MAEDGPHGLPALRRVADGPRPVPRPPRLVVFAVEEVAEDGAEEGHDSSQETEEHVEHDDFLSPLEYTGYSRGNHLSLCIQTAELLPHPGLGLAAKSRLH